MFKMPETVEEKVAFQLKVNSPEYRKALEHNVVAIESVSRAMDVMRVALEANDAERVKAAILAVDAAADSLSNAEAEISVVIGKAFAVEPTP